jgi:hypothetical protein
MKRQPALIRMMVKTILFEIECVVIALCEASPYSFA